MRRLGTTYCPTSLLLAWLTSPVSVFVMVMETLGTAAPDGSVTVPTSVASWANAWNVAANTNAQITVSQRRLWLLAARIEFSAYRDENFTTSLQRKIPVPTGRKRYEIVVMHN